MSEDRRKTNKHSTGTVPKIKCRNNTSYSINERSSPKSLTNNLASDWQRTDFSNFARNSRRHTVQSSFGMDTAFEDQHSRQNGFGSANANGGASTPNTGSSTSRRNSLGTVPKCDNVSKYPDKKHIEEKLSQIREYLRITTSLMSSMKATDDQSSDEEEKQNLYKMIKDLRDSESKLVLLLKGMTDDGNGEIKIQNGELRENGVDSSSDAGNSSAYKNEVEEKVQDTVREIDALKEQQLTLLNLQQKAENKLREARSAQDKLLSQQRNYVNNMCVKRDKNVTEQEFDIAIKELEERAKRMNEPHTTHHESHEKTIIDTLESLENQISVLHNANEDRQHLIHILDNRDVELRSQHSELQSKLTELQNKKIQVDQLAAQLQVMEEPEEEDVGGQVRKIVSMKEQLGKLQDMLAIVQNTNSIIHNENTSMEEQALASDIYAKAENFLHKDTDRYKQPQRSGSESNFALQYENNAVFSGNENRQKQVNKNSSEQQAAIRSKPQEPTLNEQLAVKAALEIKKRELEEIMGKHKAATSNLNHDVGSDHKMEFPSNNVTYEGGTGQWTLNYNHPRSHPSQCSSIDLEDDINEYSDLSPSQNLLSPCRNPAQPLSSLNYSSINTENKLREAVQVPRLEYTRAPNYERLQSASRTPERNFRGHSVTNSESRNRTRSNSLQENKNQLQKQLELIKSVCDSVLEQQSVNNQHSNVQQLRNNLTPSPLYSEPRRFTSPNPHSSNALNVVHANSDPQWPTNSSSQSDAANYQNWFSTNALQTQAFMLNTMNQCCQMLWLQQREMAALRQAVTLLQDKLEQPHQYENLHNLNSPMQPIVEPRSSNQCRPNPNKINHVAAACSMPNLNQYTVPPANFVDPAYTQAQANNMQSARLLDTCLNNVNHINTTHSGSDHINNTLLHVNPNMNQALPSQVWNGQALNNQVAPGNRANNYWDNFRSYSRQNLLSNKSNEGLQNVSGAERSINAPALHQYVLVPPTKSNSEQGSTSTSQETTPQRRAHFGIVAPTARLENTHKPTIPPDVLNINHAVNRIRTQDTFFTENNQNTNNSDSTRSYSERENTYFLNNTPVLNDSLPSNVIFKECISDNCSRRNEWHEQSENEPIPKSKLFEELRENVYREVACLISANEARPHFLIQLFRDLQAISSDTLRLKILQSIQNVITHSRHSSLGGAAQNSSGSQAATESQISDHIVSSQNAESFSLQSTVWSTAKKKTILSKNATSTLVNEELDMHETMKEIIPFLNDHETEVIQPHFLSGLKQILVNSHSFKEAVKDSIFQKHFSNVLDEVLEQYCDKKVRDVKMHLIQTLSDILRGELTFIQLIQETCPENCESNINMELFTNSLPYVTSSLYEYPSESSNNLQPLENNAISMQNGDLAEADQTQAAEDEAEEEEGAVGGLLDISQDHNAPSGLVVKQEQPASDGIEMPNLEFNPNTMEPESQFIKQGLDQVPTRLSTRSISRSNTPSRDRSNSSRSDQHSDHF